MLSSLFATFVGASLFLGAAAQGTISLQPAADPPSGTSKTVSPHFAGFGIEPSNLFSFAGYSTPNQLSINLLQNLANYTGAPAHIRLGGNTQDNMVYSPDQTLWTWINNPNSTGQGNYPSDQMLIGPNFFAAANRFPTGTPVTYGLNMAYEESDYIQRLTTVATLAVTKMPNVNVVSFEIGNEPDLYGQNGFRTGSWTGQTYTQQWLDRASAIYDQVLKPNNLPANFFEPGATASTIGTTFQIDDLDQYNIDAKAVDANTAYVSSWNQHDYFYYIGVSGYSLTLDYLMTLANTGSQFAAWVAQIQQANATPYPYALREYCPAGPIGIEGITDTFGAALWQLNFFLYAATLNITAVGMHQTDNSNASAWQPIEMYGRQPFVRPIYYGHVAFDQIIGPSCKASIYANPIAQYPTGYDERLNAYSVYQDQTLSSIVIVNAQMANASDSNPNNVTINLQLPTQFAGKTLYLAYLTNDGADSTAGTTFNGISFEASGDGTPTTMDSSIQTASIGNDGMASLTVRDSQAIVAQIGTPVGKIAADTNACAALSSSSGSSGTRSSGSTTSSSAASSTRPSLGQSTSSTSKASSALRIFSLTISTVTIALGTAIVLVL